ncbi:MAG: TRAP transporter substrate-binding protein DctP [Deltaproteobacteria bacterium]
MKYLKLSGLAMAAVLATTALADARELRTAPGAPPAHPAGGVLYPNLQKYLAEDPGDLTSVIVGPEIANVGNMKDALTSQLVDIGNLLPLFVPADLPHVAFAGELALTGTNPQAMGAAMTEYVVTCAECQAEMRKLGVVFLGAGASDVYELLTTKPIKTADDMKGMKLRTGGAPWTRFAEHFGAVPAQIPVPEQFEAMSQGVIDGTIASIADLVSYRLLEIAKYVTYVPLGTYHATSNFATTTAVWDSLSADEKMELMKAANRANTDFTTRWGAEMPGEAEAAAKAAGIEFIEPDAAFVEAVKAYAVEDQAAAIATATEKLGITDAAARVDAFNALVAKWTTIAESVDNDPVKMAEKTYDEVWSKVDMATYGN